MGYEQWPSTPNSYSETPNYHQLIWRLPYSPARNDKLSSFRYTTALRHARTLKKSPVYNVQHKTVPTVSFLMTAANCHQAAYTHAHPGIPNSKSASETKWWRTMRLRGRTKRIKQQQQRVGGELGGEREGAAHSTATARWSCTVVGKAQRYVRTCVCTRQRSDCTEEEGRARACVYTYMRRTWACERRTRHKCGRRAQCYCGPRDESRRRWRRESATARPRLGIPMDGRIVFALRRLFPTPLWLFSGERGSLVFGG